MAKRTYEMAVHFTYGGITEGETPSAEYLQTGWEKCQFQIALAGYRMADWLKEGFHESERVPAYADLRSFENALVSAAE